MNAVRREIGLFLCAVQFLTRLPISFGDTFAPDWITRSAKYFPIVGQIVGAVCALVLILGARLWTGWVPVLLAISAGVLLTGALHEDGLADSADGLAGGQDRARRLAIMKDSRVGIYGVLAVGLCLALKAAVLTGVQIRFAALLLVAAHGAGRAAVVVAMRLVPYGGDRDQAKILQAADPVTGGECLFALATALWPLVFLPRYQAVVGLVCGGLLAAAIVAAAKRLIGGQTGDILGAVEQLFELGFLLGAVVVL